MVKVHITNASHIDHVFGRQGIVEAQSCVRDVLQESFALCHILPGKQDNIVSAYVTKSDHPLDDGSVLASSIAEKVAMALAMHPVSGAVGPFYISASVEVSDNPEGDDAVGARVDCDCMDGFNRGFAIRGEAAELAQKKRASPRLNIEVFPRLFPQLLPERVSLKLVADCRNKNDDLLYFYGVPVSEAIPLTKSAWSQEVPLHLGLGRGWTRAVTLAALEHIRRDPLVVLAVPMCIHSARLDGWWEDFCRSISSQSWLGRRLVLDLESNNRRFDGAKAAAFTLWMRARGVRICFSGFGGGASRMDSLLWLKPDFVKFAPDLLEQSGSLTEIRRAMLRMVKFAKAVGVEVIVEGTLDRQLLGEMQRAGAVWLQRLRS